MLSFLFWNVNRKPVEDAISRLASVHEVDVLILAECRSSPAALLLRLAEGVGDVFHFTSSRCEKIHIYTRFSTDFLIPISEANRLTIRWLRLPTKTEILLTATHLPSKLHSTGPSPTIDCTELARSISEAEEKVGHTRTVLVGDFNINPFEEGVIAAGGLHTVTTRQVASGRSRIVQQRRYPYFYNPMWSFFGDGSEGPPGTYYYRSGARVAYFWNMFDQVLVRPELMERFPNHELKILTADGEKSLLLPSGIPDRKGASDHLPVLFKLDL